MRWLSEFGDKTKPFTAEFEESVGYGFNNQSHYFDSINKVRVVLQRDSGLRFKIVTAFPFVGDE